MKKAKINVYESTKNIKMSAKESQVRLTGIRQSNYKRILEDVKYYQEKKKKPEDEFPEIIVSRPSKKGKLLVVDGNHRLKAFIEAGVKRIRVIEEKYSNGHEKIERQIEKNLHATSTPLNKKSKIHSLKSYMSGLDKDKLIKKGDALYPLKDFAKKMEKDSDKALADASPLVEDLFKCTSEIAKKYLKESIVFADPKQRSWNRAEALADSDANKKYSIKKASSKKPSNCYVVIPVFNKGYLWNNAIGTAFKAKTDYTGCKTVLRIADDGRGEHLDTFRKSIVSEAQKINKSNMLGRGKALFDKVQVAPQKTGYEDSALEEKGFFEVVDINELDQGKRPDFDWKSIPHGGWDTTKK